VLEKPLHQRNGHGKDGRHLARQNPPWQRSKAPTGLLRPPMIQHKLTSPPR
jgi:hypothetical protein